MATKEAPETKAEAACVSTVSSLRRRLNLMATQVKAINEQGRKALKDSDSLSLFKAMFKRLDFYFNRFEETWEFLADGCEAISAPFPSSEDQTLFDAIHRYYYEATTRYDSIQRSPSSGDASQHTTDQTTQRRDTSTANHLPRISIPHFNGEITKWPTFRDIFTSLVEDDTSIPNITKLHYLTTALSGQALAVIRHLPLEGDSYCLAWEALKSTYENNRLLASAYLNTLLTLPEMPKQPSIEVLNDYLTKISESVAALRQLKIEEEADFILYHLAARGLDLGTVEKFEMDQGVSYPKIEDFIRFVRHRVKAQQAVEAVWGKQAKKDSGAQGPSWRLGGKLKTNKSLFSQSSISENAQQRSCPACSQNHRVFCCPTFFKASAEKRHAFIKDWTGCRNCLGSNHSDKDCKSPRGCRVCGKRHHTLLHTDKPRSNPSSVTVGPNLDQPQGLRKASSDDLTALSSSINGSRVILGTALADIQDINGHWHTVRLVVDSGSQNSFATASLAQRLNIPMKRCQHNISGIGQTKLRSSTGLVRCTLTPKGLREPQLTTNAITVENITGLLPQTPLPRYLVEDLGGCNLADPDFWKPKSIDLLIGADLFPMIITGAISSPWTEGPYLLPTIFGQIIMGKIPSRINNNDSTALLASDQDELTNQLKRFWELEEVSTVDDDLNCDPVVEEHFKTTHARTPKGRYIVRLPFKNPPPIFTGSEKIALKRFFNLEGKLQKDPDRRALYAGFMEEYRTLNHMSLTTERSKYVIPHHSVFKEGNIRVVFDASARTAVGSLNDYLHVGPKLQKDISQVLMNFRCHKVAFTADISKMYRQILLAEEDRAFQHVFWRLHPSHKVVRYQLNTLTYGLTSAPYLAQRTIMQLCHDEGKDFPAASTALMKDMYIDDLVTGASSLQDAIILRDQAIKLLRKGGFELGKWCSNNSQLTENISSTRAFGGSEDTGVKILGLLWNPNTDSFSYSLAPPVGTVSKRTVLSAVARIFDPLGYLAPVVFLAKSFLQTLWKDKLAWDETLTGEAATFWTNFIRNLPKLAYVRIPRLVFSKQATGYRIVGFSDASMKGYSAALYLVVTEEIRSKTFLLMAKTKLAPMKTISIPRLELQGALLLARTFKGIQNFLANIPPAYYRSPYFLTDSQIVLHWIRTPCHRLKVFVGNRISEIISLTPPSRWFHVRSEENPSDFSSRGVMPEEMHRLKTWWEGPSWLQHPESSWKISSVDGDTQDSGYIAELSRPVTLLATTNHQGEDLYEWIKHFSSFRSLINTFAYVLRFIRNSSNRGNDRGPLSVNERDIATNTLIRIVQIRHYPNFVSTKELARLNPFVDSQGVLRVGGRLVHSPTKFPQRHPVILPYKEHFTNILIDYIHKIYLHPSLDLLFSLVQSKYWIPRLRKLIRRRTFLCIICYKFNSSKRHVTPFMGNLPAPRVTPGRAFAHVGVDFAGPFQLRISKLRKAGRGKAYMCLYVCLATRALHLELVSDLTTDAFLASFSRFCARRGMPTHVYSDCGTNFIGASRELKEIFRWYHDDTVRKGIANHVAEKGITWNFNPPSAPHFGGLWETGVRSVKSVIRKVANDQALTFEEWTTLLARIEAILNSRPLGPTSSEPLDFGYLTPGHFLIGQSLLEPPSMDLSDQPINRLSRWQLITKMHRDFWKRWSQNYLSTLQQRPKWTKQLPNLSVGDFVLLKDENSHPLNWQHGRIVETFPGHDGIIRVAAIKTPTTIIRRPAAKIIPLSPLQQDPYE